MGRCHPATRAQIATGIGTGTPQEMSVGGYSALIRRLNSDSSPAELWKIVKSTGRGAQAYHRRAAAMVLLWVRTGGGCLSNAFFAGKTELPIPENAFVAMMERLGTDSLVDRITQQPIGGTQSRVKDWFSKKLTEASAIVVEQRLAQEGLTQGQRARSRSRSRSATPDQPDFDFDFGGDDGEGPSAPVLNPLQNLPRRRGGTQTPADRKGKAPLQPPVLPPLRNLPPQRLPPPMLSGIPPSQRIVPMARSRRLIPSMRWPAPMESALPPVPLPSPMLSGRPPRHPGQPPAGARRRRTAARPQKRPVRRPARYEGTPDPPPPTPRRRNAVVNPSGRPTRQRPPAVSRRRPAILKLPEVGRNQRATRPPKRLLDL